MSSQTAHPETHQEHGAGAYHVTLVALLILTLITVGASYIHFPSSAVNVVIALFIATIKATLVSLFFMHLLYDKKVNAIIAGAGFLFLGIFLGFCLIDFNTRNNFLPRNMPGMEKPTPVPDTLNPLTAIPPKPAVKTVAPVEGEEHK